VYITVFSSNVTTLQHLFCTLRYGYVIRWYWQYITLKFRAPSMTSIHQGISPRSNLTVSRWISYVYMKHLNLTVFWHLADVSFTFTCTFSPFHTHGRTVCRTTYKIRTGCACTCLQNSCRSYRPAPALAYCELKRDTCNQSLYGAQFVTEQCRNPYSVHDIPWVTQWSRRSSRCKGHITRLADRLPFPDIRRCVRELPASLCGVKRRRTCREESWRSSQIIRYR
jgi:hypothetical protein